MAPRSQSVTRITASSNPMRQTLPVANAAGADASPVLGVDIASSSVSVEQIVTRALLVCRDTRSVDMLCHCTQQMAIQIEVCPDAASATRKLCRNKFEAIVVDLAIGPDALDLIRKLHGMTSHRRAVIFAISDTEEQAKAAFQSGATFLLEKDSLPLTTLRTLRAAYPMMVAERRRYFRFPLDMMVFIRIGALPEFRARSVNLSESGMAVVSNEPLSSGDRIQLRLCLPDAADFLTLTADVCWTNAEGRAGVKFQQVLPSVRERLQNWLAARFDECTQPLAPKAP